MLAFHDLHGSQYRRLRVLKPVKEPFCLAPSIQIPGNVQHVWVGIREDPTGVLPWISSFSMPAVAVVAAALGILRSDAKLKQS